MTNKDARVEAERRFSDIDGCPVAITQSHRDAFVAGAKWARESVLAEVRARIEAIPSTPWFKADALDAIDALAAL